MVSSNTAQKSKESSAPYAKCINLFDTRMALESRDFTGSFHARLLQLLGGSGEGLSLTIQEKGGLVFIRHELMHHRAILVALDQRVQAALLSTKIHEHTLELLQFHPMNP